MSFFASGKTTVVTTHASALIFHDEDIFFGRRSKATSTVCYTCESKKTWWMGHHRFSVLTACMFTWRWAEKHSRMTGLWWVLDKCWEMLLLKHSSWLSSINMRHSEKPVWKPTYTSISWYTKPRARNQKDWARNEAIFLAFYDTLAVHPQRI